MYPGIWSRSEIEHHFSVPKKAKDESNVRYKTLMQVDKVGSEGGTLHVQRNIGTNDLRIIRGCFSGSLEEFEERVKRKPFGDRHREIYEQLIEVIKLNYVEKPKGTIRHIELMSNSNHVNYGNDTGSILFASERETAHYKTRFTWEEAEDIAKKLGIKIGKANVPCTEDTKLVWEEV
ncbi:hypothetical protein SAMN04488113_1342 [Alkalibacterium gilvum]|uniref:Uncharacterized protein n=1 Tax=Alkalibacterium gilvum TaxID=1130080 RepID=A0A1H6UK67_9LACT|nr:hypothetical protein [Alkalibacterium gilvum]SEI92733.1 hypothetical protein SAMN04488113_1342 [Alkalibacterium gilvum]